MNNSAEVIVVGLGAVGSAALYQAARLKARIIGLDRFSPPHEHGSSHGETRITRQAIGEGREFVPLVLRSNQIWEELEAATGRTLMTRNGCLVLASPNTPGRHHGSTSFLQDTIDAAREFGIAHQLLDAAELRARYPQFRVRQDESAYFEPGAGFLRPEACIEAQLELARRLGAQVFTNEAVRRITPSGKHVNVETDRATYSAGQVIVAAGAWIPKLLGVRCAQLFQVYRQTMCWFALANHRELYTPARFPVFIWITGNQPRDMMYGFPAIDAAQAEVKIATEQYESTADPDTVSREAGQAEIAALYSNYIAPRFPGVSGNCVRAATCLYTVTTDAKFVIDKVPESENVWLASACSGHGFKHSAAIGEALATAALQQQPRIDLSPFRLARFR